MKHGVIFLYDTSSIAKIAFGLGFIFAILAIELKVLCVYH